jgi:hypothetical protein
MHHEIVALESQHQPLPVDGFNFTYTLTSYEKTSTRAELHARIYHATVTIVTTVNIDAETLDPSITPNLRYQIWKREPELMNDREKDSGSRRSIGHASADRWSKASINAIDDRCFPCAESKCRQRWWPAVR